MRSLMKAPILVAITCAFVTAPVLAGTMTITPLYDAGQYSFGVGGEFRAQIGGDGWPALSYSTSTSKAVAGAITSFQTFCVEYNEHFSPGSTYNVALNDRAVWGSVGEQGDPLSVGAAYLYNEFAKGTLAGYEYTYGSGRSTSAGALQATLWWLEGEGSDPGDSNPFRHMVVYDGRFTDPKANNGGLYPVMVMNLTDAGGGRAQDMLVQVHAPLPASVLLVVFAVGVAGRKLRKFV